MSTAGDVLGLLRRHYLPEGRPPGGIFCPEIGAPSSSRRADLIWMPTTLSGGRGLVGHEIKVTRSDVLAELADPTKMDAWGQYCRRWWLVVTSPALVDGLDVPEAWGIMAPPSGRRTRSMTVVRPAPSLDHDCGPGYARVASWLFYRHDTEYRTVQAQLQHATRTVERLETAVRELQASGGGRNPDAARLATLLHTARERAREGWAYEDVSDEDIVAALMDTACARSAARSLAYRVQSAERELNSLLRPAEDVHRALRGFKLPPVPDGALPPGGEEGAA